MAGQGKAHVGVASANHDGWRRTSSWVNKIRGHKSGFIMAARKREAAHWTSALRAGGGGLEMVASSGSVVNPRYAGPIRFHHGVTHSCRCGNLLQESASKYDELKPHFFLEKKKIFPHCPRNCPTPYEMMAANMNPQFIEIGCILDRSRSMQPRQNSPSPPSTSPSNPSSMCRARLTLVLFDDQYELPLAELPIDQAPELSCGVVRSTPFSLAALLIMSRGMNLSICPRTLMY